MSPEQLAGECSVDDRSDLYALGCILFEMLAGELPFAGGSRHALISRKLTQGPPDVRQIRDSVPAEVGHVVSRCLARHPADRFRSAEDVGDALIRARQALGVTARRGLAGEESAQLIR